MAHAGACARRRLEAQKEPPMIIRFIVSVIALGLALLAGGLISGLDRKITARMQARLGPPLLQPFYDVFKLLGKDACVESPWQVFCAFGYMVCSGFALFLFFMGCDLLLIFFVIALGAVLQVMGSLAVASPFSQTGAQRELLQMLAYEPILLLVFVAISMKSGSFFVSDVYALDAPLLWPLLPAYIALGFALTIKFRKSPLDIADCHHAHQEIVRGFTTDYSGPQLAWLEIGHWFDIMLLLSICSLFWATGVWGMLILAALTYFAEILVDNTCARLTWSWMLSRGFSAAMVLCVLNIFLLYVF